MTLLPLHEIHARAGASLGAVRDAEVVSHYGSAVEEYAALRRRAGVLDLSTRGRVVLLGADRQKLLNGQVTNNVKDLPVGSGCYAALVNAKAKMLADLNIYALPNELLLDTEPGYGPELIARLEKFIIAEDVQVVDAAPHYGLLSVQGPKADVVREAMQTIPPLPVTPLGWVAWNDPTWGECYAMNHARVGNQGFDLFVPTAALASAWDALVTGAREAGGGPVGWEALEVARVEAGIPRYGADMDESHLPPECGIAERAISYTKGCYSGQEVIARIRTYGQVAKALRGLKLVGEFPEVPAAGTKLFRAGKEVGQLTSVVRSPEVGGPIALGYVRRECNGPGEELDFGAPGSVAKAVIVPLPFVGREFAAV